MNETHATDPSGRVGDSVTHRPARPEPTPRTAGFRRLLEATRIVQWEADARTRDFTYVGSQAERLLGYPLARWYEPAFWKTHLHAEDRERIMRFREEALLEQEAYEFEYRMIGAGGQSVWLHDVVAVDRVDGAPAVIRGFLIDVTERKRAEATARASEARFRQLIEQAPDAVIAVRADGRIAFVNHRAERRFGYLPGELVGSQVETLIPDRRDVERLMARHTGDRPLAEDRVGDAEVHFTAVCRDGRTFPAEISLNPLETDEGLVIIGTVRDISERQASDTALRQSEERFRIAAKLAVDIIAEADVVTGQVEWFGHVDQALGYEPGEFPRTIEGWSTHLHPEDHDRVMTEVEREVFDRRRGLRIEYRIRAKNGSYRHWAVRAAPRQEGEGRPTKFIGVCTDVTEQTVARAEALQHRDALAHVARVSSLGELTGALAHELNQPLAAILSNAQAAARLLDRDQPDVPQTREVLRDIVADDRRASAIIQRLRDMMRRDPTARERLDLCQVVREVREIMRSGLAMRGITVVPDFAADLPAVMADRIQIQQVVVNLVTNAMQAMDGVTDGRLTLGVGVREDRWQVVSVADTGPGVALASLDTMFEPFTSSRAGGLGMGLSISRSIIEAHGGRIWAENGADGGATFRFELPLDGAAGA